MSEKIASTKQFNDLNIVVSEKDRDALKEKTDKRRKEDIRSSLSVKKLLKDPKEYETYLGEISSFLESEKTCRELCKGKLSLCPKAEKGVKTVLKRDPMTSRILLTHIPCPYRQKERDALDRIDPCYLPSKTLLVSSLLSFLKDRDAFSKRKDCAFVLKDFSKMLSLLPSADRVRKGRILTSSVSKDLSLPLRRGLCYYGANKGFRCAYLNRAEFFSSLLTGNGYEVEYRQRDFVKAANASLLFLEGYEDIPKYVKRELLEKYIPSLFSQRARKGKLTYRTFSSLPVRKKTEYLLSGSPLLASCKEKINSLFRLFDIQDRDIR